MVPEKTIVLPPQFTRFAIRRLSEFGGAGLALIGLAIFISMASYNAADPSFNTAAANAPANLVGLPGAWAADLVLQSIGLAGVLLGIVCGAWGWRLMAHRGLHRLWIRVAMLPLTLLMAAIAFATTTVPTAWPLESGLGGITGDILLADLADLLGPIIGTPRKIGWVAGGLGAVALVTAMGLSAAEWRSIGRGFWWCGAGCIDGLRTLARLFGRTIATVRRERSPQEITRREPVLAEAERAGPRVKRDADTDGIVAPKVQRPAPGRRAAASRQRRLDLELRGEYELPSLDLLETLPESLADPTLDSEALAQNARLLESVLDDFGVRGEIVKVRPGPVVTLYELEPAPGTKSSRVIGLADDIARSMSAISVRAAVVPGRSVIGIELPNNRRATVSLRELIASAMYERSSAQLPLMIGKDIGGSPMLVDLARMPHLLIAGTTGSGKSVAINTMILSMLYRLSPEQCRFIMIDPKMLELSVYDGIPHLLTPVVTDPGKSVMALRWAVREMEHRYRALSNLGVRNIAGYNARLDEARRRGENLSRTVQTGFDADTGEPVYEDQPLDTNPLPLIVIVVDEMADLMLIAGKEVEAAVQRLSQMARAAGIHLMMATQRPSVDVITGTIKANFPTRISFQVTSKIDSRTILGEAGAEQLLGQGDMLYMATGGRIARVHGPFVSDDEVERVVSSLKSQGDPEYLDSVTDEDENLTMGPTFGAHNDGDDGLYDQALALVYRERKASTSFIQRHLQIGYNRAARIIERMEKEGLVSAANHVGKREVLARARDDA